MEWQRGAYTIDTARERLDLDTVARWLTGTYWAATRPVAAIHRSWQAAGLVFGLYQADRLVGCARVVTDFTAIAYLSDVYLLPEIRGQGLGRWLVETILAHPDLGATRWLLHTLDAHDFYRGFGFDTPEPRVLERARRDREG